MNKQFFLIMLLSAGFLYGCSDPKAKEKQPAAEVKPHYELAQAEQQSVRQIIKLPAQLAAYQEVSIFPKVNGYVSSVLVDIGSHLRQGQLLMVLKAPELEQATIQAKEQYARQQSEYNIRRSNY